MTRTASLPRCRSASRRPRCSPARIGAVTLSDEAKHALQHHGWSEGLAGATGIIGVTLIISFVTLVLGELAPKRLALQRNEAAAVAFAPSLNRLAIVFRPVIWLLSACTNVVVTAARR